MAAARFPGRPRPTFSGEVKTPPFSRWGMGSGSRNHPHVAWRTLGFHQPQRADGGLEEVIDRVTDRNPIVELLAESHLNLIARRLEQQADELAGALDISPCWIGPTIAILPTRVSPPSPLGFRSRHKQVARRLAGRRITLPSSLAMTTNA